jgi:hypothetical protein
LTRYLWPYDSADIRHPHESQKSTYIMTEKPDRCEKIDIFQPSNFQALLFITCEAAKAFDIEVTNIYIG